ncbi:hypothetical protein QBC32DRAFT_206007 [Pseudoneurospora amorphoporcata]|uniref:tRNA-splicing endonuclease subunit Sen34 n=1 Tax=Pseudoneurospora amorphoporcata TaxID=241081 RepID=A0AAN6NZT4_9PEZI|nr:hypothetical protein QBC32DRAFT_206007 [Pseudoneurospora amorphoporcata]
MPSTEDDRQVRISKIAGRYLVFDIDDVAYIRRQHGICAVFTGTMPQNPTQNVFLGLPLELYAEDAKMLLDRKVAYIADDPLEHLNKLKSMDDETRKSYLQSIKTQRRTAQLVFDEAKAQSQARHKDKRKPKQPPVVVPTELPPASVADDAAVEQEEGGEESFFESPSKPVKTAPVAPQKPPVKEKLPAITPTTSNAMIHNGTSNPDVENHTALPLYSYLNERGYFITPGLRFGGDFSVYPGDPFRYHAHYMANSYGWDEKIPMLDLVTSGRLGTAVKKSFLMGGQKPATGDSEAGELRAFCIEWAGM